MRRLFFALPVAGLLMGQSPAVQAPQATPARPTTQSKPATPKPAAATQATKPQSPPGQTAPQPSAQTPAAEAQAPQAQQSSGTVARIVPEGVVATINGRPITKAEMERLLIPLSPANKQVVMRDPQRFLEEYAWFEVIAKEAEKNNLADQSPYRERIAQGRNQILVQAMVDEITNGVRILAEQQKKYYDEHKGDFREVKGRLLVLPFGHAGSTPPQGMDKVMPEDEARKKADQIVGQARLGADFAKLVAEHSGHVDSRGKGGDLGMSIRKDTQQVPEPMRKAIMALSKANETTAPIRLDNGYYIFQATEVIDPPYDKIKDDIYKELQQLEVRKWLDETRKRSSAKVENPAFFQGSGAQ
jgi:hypothetical protein